MKCSEQNMGSLTVSSKRVNIIHMYLCVSYIYNYRNNTNTNNDNNNDSRNNNRKNKNKYACNFTCIYIYICVCVLCVHYVHISKPYPLWCTSHAKGPRWWSCPSKSSRKSAWRIFVALATSGNLSQRLFLLQPLYIMTTILTILN